MPRNFNREAVEYMGYAVQTSQGLGGPKRPPGELTLGQCPEQVHSGQSLPSLKSCTLQPSVVLSAKTSFNSQLGLVVEIEIKKGRLCSASASATLNWKTNHLARTWRTRSGGSSTYAAL